MSRSGDAAFAASRALIGSLRARGLAAVVISPGSRSTPMVLAAAREQGLPVHVVLDERGAAFMALGIAKSTGRPAAAVCTSGTAGANYLPAAVEATMSRTPLLLLTADRPPELRGTGANQTIDQRGLFGVHAPMLDADAFDDWADLGVRAFDDAMGPPARAIHVNMPYAEPLIPTAEGEPWRGDVARWGRRVAAQAALPDEVLAAERGVVVAGCMPERVARIERIADALGWPLLAEPISKLHGLSAAESLAADATFVAAHRLDVVLQFGAAPTTRVMQGLIAGADPHVVIDPDGWRRDPRGRARTIVADPAGLEVPTPRAEGEWLRSWKRADEAARARLDDELDRGFSERRIARDVAAAVPPGGTLLVGNSGPVRDLAVGMVPRADIHVHANRGASGIDGLVSTALGVAAVSGPTVALLGDLSFLHDLGGLAWAAGRTRDLAIVVINNGGGRIFDRLPTADLPEHERFFVTPHALEIGAVARALGLDHVLVDAHGGLRSELDRALASGGLSIVEVIPAG